MKQKQTRPKTQIPILPKKLDQLFFLSRLVSESKDLSEQLQSSYIAEDETLRRVFATLLKAHHKSIRLMQKRVDEDGV